MSSLARCALIGTLGIAGVFQVSVAADSPSGASTQTEPAATGQRARGTLEILLSQHQQRTRANASSQAQGAVPSAALPAVATLPVDAQPTAPLGTANDVRKNGVATASATPGTAPVSLQATSLERDLPAVSNPSKELAQPTSSGKESD
jgi:hypothetical protein